MNPLSCGVEKRRDQRNFFDPTFSQHHNSGGGGGGVHGKKKEFHSITAKSFSNTHTEFGARRSRRLGVMSATS